MARRIQLRRDTAAAWSAANPVLAQGEVGVDLTSNKIKIGDGTTAWNSLSYWNDKEPSGFDGSYDSLTGKPDLSKLINDGQELVLGADGKLTLPGGTDTITSNTGGLDLSVLGIDDETVLTVNLSRSGALNVPQAVNFNFLGTYTGLINAQPDEIVIAGVPNTSIRIAPNDGANGTFLFGTDGTLTTPTGLSITKQIVNDVHTGANLQADQDKSVNVRTLGNASSTFGWQNLEGDLNFVTLNYNQSKNILITTGNTVGEGISHNWVFASTGNLQLPQGGTIVDYQGNSVLGGGANTGDITFNGQQIIGAPVDGFLYNAISLVPDNQQQFLDWGQYLNIYPTVGNDAPHIHIAAGSGPQSNGDLILGDDNCYVGINHYGFVEIKSYDNLRGYSQSWYFNPNGTIGGPASGGISTSRIVGPEGEDLVLQGGNNTRSSATLRFSDADGTEKTVYTVDTNAYYVGNIPFVGGSELWFAPNQIVYVNNITLSGSTAIFTLAQPVTLYPDTDYVIDWYGTDEHNVVITTNEGHWIFDRLSGALYHQNGSYTRTTTPSVANTAPSGVIWTSLYDYVSSVKLTIQLESNEVGDASGWHSQICEAVIASRGWANNTTGYGEPVMTVYGVTYTSTVPLATFTVQRNPTTKLIEVVATRTAATTDGLDFKIHSVEMSTRD